MHPLHRFLTQRFQHVDLQITSTELDQLIRLCWHQFGYDFSGYRRASFQRRVLAFVKERDISTFEQLYEDLRLGHILWSDFLHAITVTVTEMFRDPESFQALRRHIFPYLASFPKLNIWIAGCASGEELYSCAIMLHEAGLLSRSVLYGTDINADTLEQAKQGRMDRATWEIHAENYYKAGGQADFASYFHLHGMQLGFRPFLQQQMVFLRHNLVTDQSFNQFHLILCRNVLIYFDGPLQEKVAHLFYQSLASLGFIVLGREESFAPHWQTHLQAVDHVSNCYQKRPRTWKK